MTAQTAPLSQPTPAEAPVLHAPPPSVTPPPMPKTLADTGLVEKMAAAQAKTQAISVDEVRGQWAADLGELTTSLRGGEIQSGNLWADELDKLASSWKGVSFRLTPAEPVPLMTLMMMAQGDPNQVVELLHPEFSAL